MSRKISRILSCLALACSLTLANSATAQDATGDKFHVTTTFSILADMARNVAGDAAVVTSITRPGVEIHGYPPTPGDIRRAYNADLVLWNGMGLEAWFGKFLRRLNNVPNVTVTDGIKQVSIFGGEYDGLPNPHAWMSAANGAMYVDNIRDAMMKHDPDNAEIYAANAEAYKVELAAATAPLKAAFASIPKKDRWLASSEGAFTYLTEEYDMREVYLWSINAASQGTPQQVRKVIDLVREHEIKAVFSESTVSPKSAQQVARETGSSYGGVLYVDSLSAADGPVPTYIDLLLVTGSTIVEALTK